MSFREFLSEQETLSKWEAKMKAKGYTITKDAATGTYHAWDGTEHKSVYRTMR